MILCKVCGNEQTRRQDKRKRLECVPCKYAYNKKYREEHCEELKIKKLKYRKDSKHVWKNNQLIKLYGITFEDFNALINQQSNLCAICNQPETSKRDGKIIDLSVDHHHSTGKIRALLCRSCNTSLGLLGEDIGTLNKMIDFIKKHNKE